MTFLEAMNIVDRGFDMWKDKPHNAKWYARIDGTPIPNDLKVNIAEAICHAAAVTGPAQNSGRSWDMRLADRVQQLANAGCESLTILQVYGLIAFVRDGEGLPFPSPVPSTDQREGGK